MTENQWKALKQLKSDLAEQAQAMQARCDRHANEPESPQYQKAKERCKQILYKKRALQTLMRTAKESGCASS